MWFSIVLLIKVFPEKDIVWMGAYAALKPDLKAAHSIGIYNIGGCGAHGVYFTQCFNFLGIGVVNSIISSLLLSHTVKWTESS